MEDDGKEPPEGASEAAENGEQQEEEEDDEEGATDSSGEEEEEGGDEARTKEPHSKDAANSPSETPSAPAKSEAEFDSNSSPTPQPQPQPMTSPPPREAPPPAPQAPPPSAPPRATEASILDKLASFTNGTSTQPPTYQTSSSVLAVAASATNEESAISKLSNFVKDPGKLLTTKPEVVQPVRVPRSVKVPTPPSLPAAYQQYIAAAAAVAASSYMLAAPPVSSPTLSDPDAPLDLSVKAKGLDLSTKTPAPKTSTPSSSSSTSSSKYISPPPPSKYRPAKESGFSSLKSLEQKFGSNAFPFESRSLKSQLYRHPMMPAFGGNLYTSALFNTQTLSTTDLVYKPDMSYQPPAAQSHSHRHSPRRETRDHRDHREARESHSHSHSHHSHSHKSSASKSSSSAQSSSSATRDPPKVSTPVSRSSPAGAPTASSPQSLPPSTTPSSLDPSTAVISPGSSPKDKRHTTLLCKCGKDYMNLYDLTLHLRETGHSPNDKGGVQPEYPKLVRGQDMWLNQGSEQTRQILRCMQCGESFKSLPELTVHMIDTKHYTNIVGSEAVSSAPVPAPVSVIPPRKLKAASDSGSDSEVFKCQVCELSYENMEGLSAHMMSSGHHKLPVIIQPESPRSPAASSSPKPPRVASPMSLSLMEYKYKLARLAAAHSAAAVAAAAGEAGSAGSPRDSSSPGSDFLAEISKITCETCGDRIDMGRFVEHVRACVGKRSHIKHKTNGTDSTPLSPPNSPARTPKKRKLEDDDTTSKDSKEDPEIEAVVTRVKRERSSPPVTVKSEVRDSDTNHTSPMNSSLILPPPPPVSNPTENSTGSSDSALKAMESFIERSFTSVSSHLRNRYFPFKGPVRNSFINDVTPPQQVPQNDPSRHEPRNSGDLGLNSKYTSKYLPPLYVNPDSKPITSPPRHTSTPNNDLKTNQTPMKRKNSGSRSPTPTPPVKIKKEKEDIRSPMNSHTPSPPVPAPPPVSSPKNKYIQEDEPPKSATPNKASSGVSALESLQGLVYGKSFNAEHPLDSLQKLLHVPHTPVTSASTGGRASTPGEAPNSAPNSTSAAAVHLKMNGAHPNSSTEATRGNSGTPRKGSTPPVVATASVTLLPSSLASGPPGSPLHRPRSRTPNTTNSTNTTNLNMTNSPGHHHPQTPPTCQSPRPSSASPQAPPTSSPAPPRSDGEDDGDRETTENEDLECPGCKRAFVNRGAYRYHVSRCHPHAHAHPHAPPASVLNLKQSPQNSPDRNSKRSSPIGQPYVYLPLDHTAKFTKYYEMANELANKTK